MLSVNENAVASNQTNPIQTKPTIDCMMMKMTMMDESATSTASRRRRTGEEGHMHGRDVVAKKLDVSYTTECVNRLPTYDSASFHPNRDVFVSRLDFSEVSVFYGAVEVRLVRGRTVACASINNDANVGTLRKIFSIFRPHLSLQMSHPTKV